MPSATKSTTLSSNAGYGYTLTASFVENSVNTASNSSNVTCTATLQAPSGVYWSSSYSSTLAIYWHDYKNNYDQQVGVIYPTSISSGGSLTVSGSIDVTHEDNGKLNGYAYAYFTKGGSSSYTPNSGGVATDAVALTDIARAIGINSISQVARSNDVHAQIYWTDNGNQVAIICEEITDSNEFVKLIHRWDNQKGNSGTTYSLTASERSSYDNTGRNKIRWTLRTIVDGADTFTTYQDFDYYRATTPSLSNFTVGNSVTIKTTRQRTNFTHKLVATVGSWTKTLATSATTSTTWNASTDADSIAAQSTGSSQASVTVTATTYSGSTVIGAKSTTVTATIGSSSAPTFTDFSYSDSNSTTSALLNNSSYLVQGKSTLKVSISTSQKMVAQNGATGSSYTADFGNATATASYSSSSAVSMTLGSPTTAGNSQRITVKATDSRGLSTSVYKSVNVLEYAAPVVNASIERENGFDSQCTLKIAGTFSRLLISGSAKNTVSSVKFRYKTSTTTTWGSWITRAVTISTNKYSTTNYFANLDNSSEWDIQIQVADKLSTVTETLHLSVGTPILFVSKAGRVGVNKKPTQGSLDVSGDIYTDGICYQNNQPLMPSHVGQVIITTALDTAAKVQAIYGGTWVAFGAGRTIVGVNANDTDFATANKTGGTKSVTLTTAQMPAHDHYETYGNFPLVDSNGNDSTQRYGYTMTTLGVATTKSNVVSTTGGGESHTNLQPYITAYMWRRAA